MMPCMMTLLGLGYYLLAGVVFALLGAAAHVCRAVVNIYPDRLSDKPWLDMAISDGYDLNDRVLGTEYDEAGFYRLDSRRNALVCGTPDAAHRADTGTCWPLSRACISSISMFQPGSSLKLEPITRSRARR